MSATHLTDEQVNQLNEKHGWFTYGDAQSDVSKAFAQDAIKMHELMRESAPELLASLQALVNAVENLDPQSGAPIGYEILLDVAGAAAKVISKATGSAA